MHTNLQEILSRGTAEHWATGHFNISNLEQFRSLMQAAKECASPLLIGVSEGEREFIGLRQAVALTQAFREEFDIPVFLNADHSKSLETATKAINAGFDSIHIDASAMPYEENIAATKQVVEHARNKGGDIWVEGELGYLRGSSTVQNVEIEVKPEDFTDPFQAKEFVERTGVNRLAIAVGNIHGIALNEPAIDVERIAAIRQVVPITTALVLHAASGIKDDVLKASIEAGITNIHINTDIRILFTQKLREFLAAHPEETTPYKLFGDAMSATTQAVKEKLQIFGSCGKV